MLYLNLQNNHTRKRALHDTLEIGYCDKYVHGDSLPNQSIQKVANGPTVSPWYGPVPVMKRLGLEANSSFYGDMDLGDYRDAVDALVYEHLPGKIAICKDKSQMQSLYSGHNIKGVRISCDGDIRFLGAETFVPVDVSIFDPVDLAHKSKSSEMVGVPIRVRKLPPHPAWKDSGICSIQENQGATFLFRAMDPEQEDFSFVPVYWDYPVGSVLVVRADGKDITPQQVEALCYYSSEHTVDKVQDAMEYQGFTGSNEEMVKLAALFHPGEFRKFFADFKAKKMGEDASWVTAVSPV